MGERLLSEERKRGVIPGVELIPLVDVVPRNIWGWIVNTPSAP